MKKIIFRLIASCSLTAVPSLTTSCFVKDIKNKIDDKEYIPPSFANFTWPIDNMPLSYSRLFSMIQSTFTNGSYYEYKHQEIEAKKFYFSNLSYYVDFIKSDNEGQLYVTFDMQYLSKDKVLHKDFIKCKAVLNEKNNFVKIMYKDIDKIMEEYTWNGDWYKGLPKNEDKLKDLIKSEYFDFFEKYHLDFKIYISNYIDMYTNEINPNTNNKDIQDEMKILTYSIFFNDSTSVLDKEVNQGLKPY